MVSRRGGVLLRPMNPPMQITFVLLRIQWAEQSPAPTNDNRFMFHTHKPLYMNSKE